MGGVIRRHVLRQDEPPPGCRARQRDGILDGPPPVLKAAVWRWAVCALADDCERPPHEEQRSPCVCKQARLCKASLRASSALPSALPLPSHCLPSSLPLLAIHSSSTLPLSSIPSQSGLLHAPGSVPLGMHAPSSAFLPWDPASKEPLLPPGSVILHPWRLGLQGLQSTQSSPEHFAGQSALITHNSC